MNYSPKILVIDDEKYIRQSFSDYLEDLDFDVLLAENGKTGLEAMISEKPDLVLVDLIMPDMNGLELLQEGKKHLPDLPIIIISGANLIGHVVRALRYGAWDYLEKPIQDFSILGHSVDKALEKARLIKENKAYQKRLESMVRERTRELEDANTRLSNTNARLHKIVETTQKLTGFVDMKEFGLQILNEFSTHMAASGGSLYLVEEKGLKLISSIDPGHASAFIPFPLAENSILKIVLDRGEPILIGNIKEEKWIAPSGWPEYPNGSLLAFPIHDNYGTHIGIITLHGKNEPPFVEQDKEIGAILASYSCETIRAIKAFEDAKIIERQLHQSQKMEAIGTLAGGIAHDFNNILSGIIGYSELAKININAPDSALQYIKQAMKGAKRAGELVTQILTFSRQGKSEMKPLQLSLIVKEAAKFLRSSIPSTIQIIENIDSKGIVAADATQVHQVVMNLCTNAYHAMKDTGGTLSFKLQDITFNKENMDNVCPPGQYIMLEIQDTGCGIDEQHLDRIFDPYFTTKEVSQGTGLGLAVVNGIVKKHNGFIKLSSQFDSGTVFQVFFPVFEQQDIQVPENEFYSYGFNGTERIMLVDDEKVILDTTRELLSNMGYTVTCFKDSAAALETFKRDPDNFDMVITDMTMPKMDGRVLSKKILSIKRDIPIILCTGFYDGLDEQTAIPMGIRRYLQKPIAANHLASIIRKEFDKKN
jgi:signal transduction histidine kinase